MPYQSLTEEEELKIDRLPVILHFLGKKEAFFFIINNMYRFDVTTECFSNKYTGLVVAPNENIIDTFYRRLSNEAIAKLYCNLNKSKIKDLKHLLVKYYKLEFLSIGS